MAPHRMPHLATDASAQACSTLAKASVFSCWMVWKFWGQWQGEGSPVDKAIVVWAGHPTTQRPLVAPLAA